MAKITAKYETVLIINPTLSEENIAANVEKIKDLVLTNGVLRDVEEWGKRRLAYPINDLADGYYVLIRFESEPSFPAELDRVYKITDSIMRSIIICIDE